MQSLSGALGFQFSAELLVSHMEGWPTEASARRFFLEIFVVQKLGCERSFGTSQNW